MNNKKKMLIVEDDTDLLKMYTVVFSGSEFETTGISSPQEAIESVKVNKYDAILLDLMYPGGDNLQTIRLIRSEQSLNKDTPIIILTNLNAGDKTKKSLEYGANECLFKAKYTPKTLLSEVTNILKTV